jgi:hypothetical protein
MALWAFPRCWAHLAGVSGAEKMYSWSIIIIKIYPALSTVIGGRDGMDCSRRFWMMYSIKRKHHQSWLLGLFGAFGGSFVWEKMYSGSIIIIKIYPTLSTTVGRRDGMDCSRSLLDDLFYK